VLPTELLEQIVIELDNPVARFIPGEQSLVPALGFYLQAQEGCDVICQGIEWQSAYFQFHPDVSYLSIEIFLPRWMCQVLFRIVHMGSSSHALVS
jgi:hypothetical protein